MDIFEGIEINEKNQEFLDYGKWFSSLSDEEMAKEFRKLFILSSDTFSKYNISEPLTKDEERMMQKYSLALQLAEKRLKDTGR